MFDEMDFIGLLEPAPRHWWDVMRLRDARANGLERGDRVGKHGQMDGTWWNKSSTNLRGLCVYINININIYIYILFHVFRSFLHVTCAKVRFDVKYNREKGSGTNFAMTCNYDQVWLALESSCSIANVKPQLLNVEYNERFELRWITECMIIRLL